ncbi:BZ3500_MvSof-1268-A1-R1_Chr12-3g04011 [Microbotryum saponariae]|uniref:BZ3500_MvSof-1268-A1-R1_Chr12-3g04011 protein n=1 Tax=Microbotryum saponariae TaxID=289078 RepID=A0A2X0N5S1_9BASI|nr:BZ3500_MvSof-1268-A1-R1_Chr12-3g04011 [Microbotryum saponariae]SDA02532.1 BZ3501_MvSof-1269-A2-R1_Chr12-3g03666 [Microbotryum saponariae]
MTPPLSTRAHLLFVRTPSQPVPQDPYHSFACSSHFTPHHLPILETTYQNIPHLAHLLNGPKIYDGLIITSARSVQAIAKAQRVEPTQAEGLGSFYQTPIFAVGQATAEALRTQLLRPPPEENVLGNDGTTGSGEKLARFISRYFKGDPPGRKWKLLYLVGDKNRETLANLLEVDDGRFELDKLRVYQTKALEGKQLENEVDRVVQEVVGGDGERNGQRKRLWIILFSPSGAKAACQEFRRRGWIPNVDDKDQDGGFQIRIAAIGPVTRAYLQDDERLKVDAEARTPDAEDLLRCIIEVEDEESGHAKVDDLALGRGGRAVNM